LVHPIVLRACPIYRQHGGVGLQDRKKEKEREKVKELMMRYIPFLTNICTNWYSGGALDWFFYLYIHDLKSLTYISNVIAPIFIEIFSNLLIALRIILFYVSL